MPNIFQKQMCRSSPSNVSKALWHQPHRKKIDIRVFIAFFFFSTNFSSILMYPQMSLMFFYFSFLVFSHVPRIGNGPIVIF